MIPPAIHPGDPGELVHVEFRGWSVRVDGREHVRWIDLEVPRGRIVALVSPAGSGKSVLLSSVNRSLDDLPGAQTEGSVLLGGDPLWGRGVDDLALRRRTGTVFRHAAVLPGSVHRNVAFPLLLDGWKAGPRLDETVETALRSVGAWERLRDHLHRPAVELRAGLRQLVNLARACNGSPEVLLLDEPCADLDPRETEIVERALLDLAGRHTVLLATHNLAQASRLPHRVAFLLDGQLVEYGPTDRVFQRPIRSRTEDYLSGRFG